MENDGRNDVGFALVIRMWLTNSCFLVSIVFPRDKVKHLNDDVSKDLFLPCIFTCDEGFNIYIYFMINNLESEICIKILKNCH